MSEYVSQEGLAKLKEELHHLKTEKRADIARRLEHAKSLGDLSENAEYQETKEEQSFVEGEIVELEERIRNVLLIEKNRKGGNVAVGSTVRVQSDHGETVYTIVGFEESDPMVGKISNESPLGRAFLGHKTGDAVEVRTPGGIISYKIVEIY